MTQLPSHPQSPVPVPDMKPEKKDVDYILEYFVGGFGRWQVLNTLCFWPTIWVAGLPVFMTIYSLYTPSHRCFVAGCDDSVGAVVVMEAPWNNFTIPRGK